jgi:anaerobic glycerol-3-phosphate dehydrogenase
VEKLELSADASQSAGVSTADRIRAVISGHDHLEVAACGLICSGRSGLVLPEGAAVAMEIGVFNREHAEARYPRSRRA